MKRTWHALPGFRVPERSGVASRSVQPSHRSRIARSFGSISVKAMPIPVGVTLPVTLPMALSSPPAWVIRTRTRVPFGRGVVVLTKQPDELRSRVIDTNSPGSSKSLISAIAPMLRRLAARALPSIPLLSRAKGLQGERSITSVPRQSHSQYVQIIQCEKQGIPFLGVSPE